MKKLITTALLFMGLTGCLKTDHMDDVNIKVTNYPIEFITNYLYSETARSIESIYPDNTNINDYKLKKNEIKKIAESDLFIYNGTSNEPDYSISSLSYNKKLKIIDAAKAMEYTYGQEELWLDPYNLLMLAGNIKNGFSEYIDDAYKLEGIQNKYDELNLKLSEIDVEYKEIAETSTNKTIIVSNDIFNFLSKYGINVISLDPDTVTPKIISDAKTLIWNHQVEYIFLTNYKEENNYITKVINETGVKTETLHTLSNITDKERNIDKLDYFTLTENNMEKLKKELFN